MTRLESKFRRDRLLSYVKLRVLFDFREEGSFLRWILAVSLGAVGKCQVVSIYTHLLTVTCIIIVL